MARRRELPVSHVIGAAGANGYPVNCHPQSTVYRAGKVAVLGMVSPQSRNMASGCQGERIEIADVNARNALDNEAKANSRTDDLESEVEDLKARVEELENAQE